MKQLKELTQDEYKKLKKSDMLTILYPEATGDYYKDTNDFYIKFPLAKDWNISVDISRNNTYLHFAESGWYKIGEKILYVKEGSSEVCNEHDEIRKAKPSEIEAHLIEEAKRRGFVAGNKFKSLTTGYIYEIETQKYAYHNSSDALDLWGTACIYKQGKWAEIINDELIKINGYDVEFESNGIKVGCKHIDKYDLERLKSFYLLTQKLGLPMLSMNPCQETIGLFEPNGVYYFNTEFSTLERILDKLNA
jgi:hypothetical protein